MFEVGATPTDVPTMPIEFSVAGFRLGHSMIRARLQLEQDLRRRLRQPRAAVHVLGHRRQPRRRRCACRATGSPTSAASTTSRRPASANLARAGEQVQPREGDRHPPRRPAAQPARQDLRRLGDPERRPAAEPRVPQPHARADGQARDRPADGDVHEEQGRELPQARRRRRSATARAASCSTRSPRRSATRVLKDTPLWFYILREAEFNGGQLRGVGARIVAETIHRAIEGSQVSIVRDPAWRADARPQQHDVPDGRPAAVRLRGEEDAAGPARLEGARHLDPVPCREGGHVARAWRAAASGPRPRGRSLPSPPRGRTRRTRQPRYPTRCAPCARDRRGCGRPRRAGKRVCRLRRRRPRGRSQARRGQRGRPPRARGGGVRAGRRRAEDEPRRRSGRRPSRRS